MSGREAVRAVLPVLVFAALLVLLSLIVDRAPAMHGAADTSAAAEVVRQSDARE